MESTPRISIVTPNFNQGELVVKTVESLLAQNYPDVEHIVVDCGSTDQSLKILGKYKHLKILQEPDGTDVARAINEAFRQATGTVGGYLLPGDILLPGALKRVAEEIDPARDRHIVMGRCRLINSKGEYIGVEHPSRFTDHRHVLAVWRGQRIPQPSTFWTMAVWADCGPMDELLGVGAMDYDMFCRFSKRYVFHFVNQALSASRLRENSVMVTNGPPGPLEETFIEISRRYWGSRRRLLYWRLELSLARHRLNRCARARRHLVQGVNSWHQGERLAALGNALAGGLMAPEVAFCTIVYPAMMSRATITYARLLAGPIKRRQQNNPITAMFKAHTELWDDRWAGPRLVLSRTSREGDCALKIVGWADPITLRRPLTLRAFVNEKDIGKYRIEKTGEFCIRLPFTEPLPSGLQQVEICADDFHVDHYLHRNEDYRPLSWKLFELELTH